MENADRQSQDIEASNQMAQAQKVVQLLIIY